MPDLETLDPVAEYQAEMNLRTEKIAQQAAAEANRRQDLFGVPQAVENASRVTICSVWPEPLESQAFQHSYFDEATKQYKIAGRFTYKIAAGSPSKPAYLHLYNNFSMVIGKDNDERQDQPRINKAADYAANIVQFWADNTLAAHVGKKGIGIIVGDEATPQELAFLEQAQRSYLSFLVEHADSLADSKHPNDHKKIGPVHRMALKLLGQDESQHKWSRTRVAQNAECPECGERILARALKCKHCQCNIVKFFVDRNLTPDPKLWPGVANEIERLTAPKSQKEK